MLASVIMWRQPRCDGERETSVVGLGMFEALVEAAPMAIAVHVDGRVVYANRGAEDVLGVRPGQVHGMHVLDLVHPDFVELARHRAGELLAGRPLAGSVELDLVRPDGSTVTIEYVSSAIDVDGRTGVCVMACDITERARREAHFAHLAAHDGLTGLPNRILLLDRLEQALARVGRGCAGVLVLFVDLDGFKRVNDEHGHAAGDLLLGLVAERLRSAVRGMDTVARLGGDEFVVVAELETLDLADHLQSRLEQALNRPYELDAVPMPVPASVGTHLVTQPCEPAQALRDADRLMYEAKARRRDDATVLGRTRAGA